MTDAGRHAGVMAEETAETLALRAQKGGAAGTAAYSQLVKQFHGRIYNFLLRRLKPSDAEDVTQEAFIRAWQRIDSYNPQFRFSTWIFTIATRLAISHGRAQKRAAVQGSGEVAREQGERSDPGDSMLRIEERDRIWQLVEQLLSPEQQNAMWLRYVEEMAIADIARVMGRTQVGVRVMLFRARNVLAERLEWTEEGVRENGATEVKAAVPGAHNQPVGDGAVKRAALCRVACAGSRSS